MPLFSPEEALKIERAGEKLQEFLEDELIHEMIDKVISRYHASWEETDPKDAATRESLYLRIRALRDIMREFQALIDEAKASRIVARSIKLKGEETV